MGKPLPVDLLVVLLLLISLLKKLAKLAVRSDKNLNLPSLWLKNVPTLLMNLALTTVFFLKEESSNLLSVLKIRKKVWLPSLKKELLSGLTTDPVISYLQPLFTLLY